MLVTDGYSKQSNVSYLIQSRLWLSCFLKDKVSRILSSEDGAQGGHPWAYARGYTSKQSETKQRTFAMCLLLCTLTSACKQADLSWDGSNQEVLEIFL